MSPNPYYDNGRSPNEGPAPSLPLRLLGRDARVEALLRQPSEDLAYILGAWAAHTEVGTPLQRHLSFCSRDRGQIRRVAQALARFCGEPVAVRRVDQPCDSFRVRHCCPSLSAHLHDVTRNNKRVPWEHLGSDSEMATFLRGLVDNAGWLTCGSSPGLGLSKVRGLALLEDISRVFLRLGIYPLLPSGTLPTLKLRERADWLMFRERVGFSGSEARAKLQRLCGMRAQKRSFTVEEYQLVMFLRLDRGLSPGSIAERTLIPRQTVRDWTERGQVPRVVVRYRALLDVDGKHPDAAAITSLFREKGMSPEEARARASQIHLRSER